MKKQIVQISFEDNNLVYMLVSEQPEELDEFFKIFCDTFCFYAGGFMKWTRQHDVKVNKYQDGKGDMDSNIEVDIRTIELKNMGKYYSWEEVQENFEQDRLE